MKDTTQGDSRAIVSAIVALLNTLALVVGLDLGNVIAEIEKIGTMERAESVSSDEEGTSDFNRI